jgi:hypothetical protein
MKLLVMPQATPLRQKLISYKDIVATVLQCRPEITAKRKDIIKTPSIIYAEFTREREKLEDFRAALKVNIQIEKEK